MISVKKILTVYSVCLLLAIIGAYLDRNDPSGGYVTPAITVFETFMMSFVVFFIFGFFYSIAKLISLGIKKMRAL